MKRLAILALACLAGCTTTQRVLEAGEQHAYTSAISPHELAKCTAFNASSVSRNYVGEVRAFVRPDSYEVVVTRIRHWDFEPIIVAHATAAPGGSQLVVFVGQDVAPATAADWIERLRRGCGVAIRPPVVVPMPVEIPPAPRPLPASPAPRAPRG